MARAERAALANMRAIEEQNFREEMHSSLSGGGRFIGAGATPSMGLSEFRGGRKKCSECNHKRCICEESSSDEDEMEGGAAPIGSTYRAFLPRVSVPYRGTTTSTALVPYNAALARSRMPSRPIVPYVPRPTVRNPTALVVKPSGSVKPYNAAEAQFRLNPPKPVAPKTLTSKSTMGSRARLLAGLAATGIALGLSGAALNNYIADQANSSNGPNGGPGEPPIGDGSGEAYQPPDEGDYDGTGSSTKPNNGNGTGMSKSDLAFYLQTGNLADSQYSKGMRGKGKSDGRSARAAIVRKVMKEKGMSMIEASKHVKANNLY